MLSQTVEYALRAALHLAGEAPAARTTDQIAEATLVPRAYLAKVLQSLNRAGLIRAQRGVGGGMTLAKSADEVTVLEVINAVEPLKRIRRCPLELEAHGERLCALHQRLDSAMALVENAFAGSTLANLLNEATPSPPLCEFPKAGGAVKEPAKKPA